MGNGRRGGRVPTLLIAALTSFILVLGFNYWVSNSRIAELQAQLYEMEVRVRRVGAEREEVEQKKGEVEEEVKRQNHQIRELEEQQRRREAVLQLNVSSCAKTVLDMKNELRRLMEDVGKVQKELDSCQSSVNTLNQKLTYDMTQCNTQLLAQKDECDEKLAAARKETQKRKISSAEVIGQKNSSDHGSPTHSKPEQPTRSTGGEPSKQSPQSAELQTNHIFVDQDPPATSKIPETNQKNVIDVKEEEVGGVLSIIGQKQDKATKPVANQDKATGNEMVKVKIPLTEEEALIADGDVEYNEEQQDTENTDGVLDLDDEMAAYKEENEPEEEAEKQAALARD
ncbi:Golgi membrane protein 1 isoform X2 [Denticeps clupeoides]|nr:Golgi membrane protein 1 isoform X2 [Denticeps clupeoides]XP_028821185.1 Golgi membrane protein 1 isoform X2 [Denticeps clupeoides]